MSRTEIYARLWTFLLKSSLHEGFRCWGLCLAHCGGGSCPLGQLGVWVGRPVGVGANLCASDLWVSTLGRMGIVCGARGRCCPVLSPSVGAPDSTVASQPIVFFPPLFFMKGLFWFFFWYFYSTRCETHIEDVMKARYSTWPPLVEMHPALGAIRWSRDCGRWTEKPLGVSCRHGRYKSRRSAGMPDCRAVLPWT